jgi:nanoRNase/pAp phosphatase (c-di-AMP/oligoRNAs hydrolase)
VNKDPRRFNVVRNARRILRFLEARRESISPLLILTHDYPDPDSLASAVALQYIAEHFGIVSRVVYGGILGRNENRGMVQILKLPVHKLKHSDLKRYQYTALLDTQPEFENNSFPKNRKATMIIDQHASLGKPSADLTIVDPDCGATCVILARAVLLLKKGVIPSRLAAALAYGILTDTLNLYRAPQGQVIDTYRDIIPFCDLRALARIQNPTRSRRFFGTLAKGIQRAMVRRGLIVSHLGSVENPDVVSQTADFLLTCKGVRYSCCTGRFRGNLHVSLRTAVPGVEAGRILRDIFANRGEAGGHGPIAGGSFKLGDDIAPELWDEMEMAFAESLSKRLRIPKKTEFIYPFRSKN